MFRSDSTVLDFQIFLDLVSKKSTKQAQSQAVWSFSLQALTSFEMRHVVFSREVDTCLWLVLQGAMITHKNFVASTAGMAMMNETFPGDV